MRRVNIINMDPTGHFFFEGTAQVAKDLGDNRALVRFGKYHGGPPFERYIDPEAQGDNVQEYIDELNRRRQ